MTTDRLVPPLLTLHRTVSGADPFETARRGAATGDFAAGDVVFSADNRETAALAIVLEPDVPAGRSQQMLPLSAVALADALGVLLPPKVAIEHRWPGTLLANGASVARLSMVMAAANGDEPPDWLVVGIRVALSRASGAPEGGEAPDQTVLAEEGGGGIGPEDVLRSLAAHFLHWLDTWQDIGFEPVAREWLFRAEGRASPRAIAICGETVLGRVLGVDDAANLCVALSDGAQRRLDLLSALAETSSGAGADGS